MIREIKIHVIRYSKLSLTLKTMDQSYKYIESKGVCMEIIIQSTIMCWPKFQNVSRMVPQDQTSFDCMKSNIYTDKLNSVSLDQCL